MVEYCQSIIHKIQKERGPQRVEEVVNDSISGFKAKSRNTNKYIMNMIVMLQNSSLETTDATEQCNMRAAIHKFREYHRKDSGILF